MASTSSNTPGTSGNSSSNDSSKDNRWYFTAEQLANSPSRRQGIDTDQELSFRQLTAYLIQEMGQRLQVSQLCINTAIVYMHRFYAFHSFTHFHRNGIAAAALFLAAKVEEQPRKLEHVIKVAHICLNQEAPHPSSDLYAEQAQDLVFNENVLLQTLGFDVAIDHPHTHVVKTCHLVKACKDLAQTSYFLASNSLHLTPMCLQYRPTVVACFCIYLACKWSRWEIPQSTEGRHWFHYVDKTVTMDLLKQLTDEFIAIYEKSPARLKSKLNSIKALAQGARIPEPSRSLSESSNGSSSQVNPLEPARRPESYSSHHRSHHTSSSSHPPVPTHHHHSKLVNETGEHKSSSSQHKQSYPPTAAGHSSRPRPERSQTSSDPQYTNLHGGSKQQLPVTASSRSSSSGSNRPQHNIPPLVGGSSSAQRVSSHGGHDPNVHHKSRSSVPSQINPSGHKVMPKVQESTRPVMKDPSSSVRPLIDPSKLPAKHPSTSNAYASQNSNNVGIDMTRNVLQSQTNLSAAAHQTQQQPQQQQQSQTQQQQQRSYLPQTSSQPANYSQSTLNRGNISRYDQSVQQPTAHSQSNQKQSTESSFGITNPKSSIDENIKSGDQMEICSPPKSSYSQNPVIPQQQQQHMPQYQQASQQQQNQQQQQQQQQQPQSVGHQKLSSIFSPEWNERVSQPNNLVNISSNTSNNNMSKLGFNVKSNRDSPKKSERERKSETPKKDKVRSETQQQMQAVGLPTKFTQAEKRIETSRIQDPSLQSSATTTTNTLPPFDVKSQQQQTHALNFSAVKRRASRDNMIKFNNEDPAKDVKIRKIEPQSSPKLPIVDPKSSAFYNMYEQPPSQQPPFLSTNDSKQQLIVKAFPTTVNGIETNPDLVSSLLKESLCREGKVYATPLIKTEPKDTLENVVIDNHHHHHHQPIIMETLPEQLLQTDVPVTADVEIPTLKPSAIDELSKSKSEKKKKKDKHKHKEKDKSKDKDERKKHKKDKDRHKDKEQRQLETTNPVKIKISGLPGLDTANQSSSVTSLPSSTPAATGFKIKIPKDRIKGELSNFQSEEISSAKNFSQPSTSSLKIKISKDKIENFNNQQQQQQESSSSYTMVGSGSHHHHHHHGSHAGGGGGSSSSSSSKKKDRDRDRDKDKKKSNNDHGKQNVNGGSKENSLNSATGILPSSLKNQQSSNLKIQQHQQYQQQQQHQYNGSSNNNNNNNVSMSQLFGESHDDDDDDEDNDFHDNNDSYESDFTDSKDI